MVYARNIESGNGEQIGRVVRPHLVGLRQQAQKAIHEKARRVMTICFCCGAGCAGATVIVQLQQVPESIGCLSIGGPPMCLRCRDGHKTFCIASDEYPNSCICGSTKKRGA